MPQQAADILLHRTVFA